MRHPGPRDTGVTKQTKAVNLACLSKLGEQGEGLRNAQAQSPWVSLVAPAHPLATHAPQAGPTVPSSPPCSSHASFHLCLNPAHYNSRGLSQLPWRCGVHVAGGWLCVMA